MKINEKEILNKIKTFENLKKEKSLIFGQKGIISQLRKKIATASIEEKIEIGKEIKMIKERYNIIFSKAIKTIEEEKTNILLKTQWQDVTTLISISSSLHPITKIINLMTEWLTQNGYYNNKCNEIESDEYNFTKLNISKDHPSRNMHDTLYISNSYLLRTHNTGATARLIKMMKNTPFAAFTIGKVYRNDIDDATHSHQFTQCDIVATGDVSFANLKWTLHSLINYVFEKKIKTRIRPSYFPFTIPSLEMDIYFKGKWIEILGAGMLNNNVFKLNNIKEKIRGFAAGIGIERIAMIKYNIIDIRDLYNNDLRFLNQFKGVR